MTSLVRLGTPADRDQPWYFEERTELLRSGPLARLRKWSNHREVALVAAPDRSLRAHRTLKPQPEPWTIEADADTTAAQAYRRAFSRVVGEGSLFDGLPARGGAALLGYPQGLRDFGLSPELQVARLETTTRDGHRLVALELRNDPGDPRSDRQVHSFEFDADQGMITRTLHHEFNGHRIDQECRYVARDGRPVVQAIVTRPADSSPSDPPSRLDVESCEFGPISAAEFAVEPVRASLGPDVVGHREDNPTTATVLDWYWVAFVLGGVDLAGGLGLIAWRRRDRKLRLGA